MRNLLNPKWLFLINTLPIVILFLLFFGEYNIIHSLLKEENISLWIKFGVSLAILSLLNFLYIVYLIIKKQEISQYYGIVSLICYITFIYQYFNYNNKLIPISIPNWMIPGDMIIYVGAFLMPTLAYSLFILVIHYTPENEEKPNWKNFIIAISIPIFWYIFFQLLLPLWQQVNLEFIGHTFIILFIISFLAFLFFIIRGCYILGLKKSELYRKYQLAWKIPISMILPLIGLALNNKFSFVFGDFSSSWFYILVILNGILICLPNLENKFYRIFLFIGRNITFAFTLYFLFVFLPFLPFSILAIFLFGAGLLMLSPLVLFIFHVIEISNDFKFLRNYFPKNLIIFISLLSFIIIPAFITFSYLIDKKVLNETLNYIYNPDYSKSYNIDKTSLSNTLSAVRGHSDRSGNDLFGCQIPFLSSYFNWIVLDNMTLSDAKINYIERIFYNHKPFKTPQVNLGSQFVKLSKINSTSKYDEKQNNWISCVDLEITNNSANSWSAEYATSFELPTGCWISDYYLNIANTKEMGILSEKKAAMWVFSQIRNTNRDPGILYYLSGNKVELKVFPFAKNETRKTGIEFIHKEPVKLYIDGNTILLGNDSVKQNQNNPYPENNNVIYISAKEKQNLKAVQRNPYYHFMIDVSKNNEKQQEDFIKRIENLLNKNLISPYNTKVSFVNSYTTTIELKDYWKKKFRERAFEGGFYLDRAVKKTLFDSYTNLSNSYPIIVVVTNNLEKVIIENDFSDLKFAYPETDNFYLLKNGGELIPHSLSLNPIFPDTNTFGINLFHKVLAYPNEKNPIAYLANDNEPSIILKNAMFNVSGKEISEKNWQTALIMQGKWTSQILHPETSENEWLNIVRFSFKSKIMTPLTSYLVVENEAQKAILKNKQKQVLAGNKALDIDDSTQRMSEPGLILLIFLLGIFIWITEKRKKRIAKL